LESGNDLSDFYGKNAVYIRFSNLVSIFLIIQNRLGSLGMNSGESLFSRNIMKKFSLSLSLYIYIDKFI